MAKTLGRSVRWILKPLDHVGQVRLLQVSDEKDLQKMKRWGGVGVGWGELKLHVDIEDIIRMVMSRGQLV